MIFVFKGNFDECERGFQSNILTVLMNILICFGWNCERSGIFNHNGVERNKNWSVYSCRRQNQVSCSHFEAGRKYRWAVGKLCVPIIFCRKCCLNLWTSVLVALTTFRKLGSTLLVYGLEQEGLFLIFFSLKTKMF